MHITLIFFVTHVPKYKYHSSHLKVKALPTLTVKNCAFCLSPNMLWFNPRPVRVEFVVQKVAILILPCQYHSTNAPHSFIHLSITVIERQVGTVCNPSDIRKRCIDTILHVFWVTLTPSGSHPLVLQAAVTLAPNHIA
jgi:hypothetical protein